LLSNICIMQLSLSLGDACKSSLLSVVLSLRESRSTFARAHSAIAPATQIRDELLTGLTSAKGDTRVKSLARCLVHIAVSAVYSTMR